MKAYTEPVLIQCFIDAVLILGWCTTHPSITVDMGTVASATDICPVCEQAASLKAASLLLIRFSVLHTTLEYNVFWNLNFLDCVKLRVAYTW